MKSALEHAEERAPQLTATAESTDEDAGSPESDHTSDQDAGGSGDSDAPEGIWARLVRFWKGR